MTPTVEVASAVGVGIAAGLGLAAPLGAIGVLLLQEGIERGRRRAFPAAVAVAGVDTTYCIAAMLAGAVAAPAIEQFGSWPQAIGAIVLLGVATAAIVRALRPLPSHTQLSDQGARGRFALFVGLTAINPATLVYFAAIAVPMAQSLGGLTATAFVIGVGLASLLWQVLLVFVGAYLGSKVTPNTRRITVIAGNLVVAAFGTAMLIHAAS